MTKSYEQTELLKWTCFPSTPEWSNSVSINLFFPWCFTDASKLILLHWINYKNVVWVSNSYFNVLILNDIFSASVHLVSVMCIVVKYVSNMWHNSAWAIYSVTMKNEVLCSLCTVFGVNHNCLVVGIFYYSKKCSKSN